MEVPAAKLLEISLISAQDLASVSKSMHTYAVAWITPNHKYTTTTDTHGHNNPTWNDRFIFTVPNQENNATITVEIYANTWFLHILVGTFKVRVADLLSPLLHDVKTTRFVALQVCRPSGTPQGILNLGVALLDGRKEATFDPKTHLYRSLSTRSSNNRLESTLNGENGSELNSDIGPSASIVAAELAHKHYEQQKQKQAKKSEYDTESSILEDLTAEEAHAKGYRIEIRKDKRRSGRRDDSDDSELSMIKHPRRNSDNGLCSCFVCGVEFTVVCGESKSSRRKRTELESAN